LWDQLGLNARHVLHDADPSTTTSTQDAISIALSHVTLLEAQVLDCANQLCYRVSPADVEPPAKIAVVELKAVRLTLDFSTTPKVQVSKKRKRNRDEVPERREQPELLIDDLVRENGEGAKLYGNGKQSHWIKGYKLMVKHTATALNGKENKRSEAPEERSEKIEEDEHERHDQSKKSPKTCVREGKASSDGRSN
jgi:hypothetical protein